MECSQINDLRESRKPLCQRLSYLAGAGAADTAENAAEQSSLKIPLKDIDAQVAALHARAKGKMLQQTTSGLNVLAVDAPRHSSCTLCFFGSLIRTIVHGDDSDKRFRKSFSEYGMFMRVKSMDSYAGISSVLTFCCKKTRTQNNLSTFSAPHSHSDVSVFCSVCHDAFRVFLVQGHQAFYSSCIL